MIQNPQPHLNFSINTNACPPGDKWKNFVELLQILEQKNCVNSVNIFVSAESKGNHAEYVRMGMDWFKFDSNVNYLLTQTAGEAIMTHRYIEYQPFKGEIPGRQNGSLISLELGKSIPFSLNNLQERGTFFIGSNQDIYEGQVIGENSRAGDLCVNVTKTKKMSNMRSSGADDKVRIAPPRIFSLEECLEYIQRDEYVEVTPQTLRIRKILLKEMDRKRAQKN